MTMTFLRRAALAALLLASLPAAGMSTASAQPFESAAYFQDKLRDDIQSGRVSVVDRGGSVSIVISLPNMFSAPGLAGGGDRIQPALFEVLGRVGYALGTPSKRVLVIGHSDSDPISTPRFRNKLELTRAHAEAATRLLAVILGSADHFTSVGKADTQPIADNRTPEGKARNRRLEIVVYQPQ